MSIVRPYIYGHTYTTSSVDNLSRVLRDLKKLPLLARSRKKQRLIIKSLIIFNYTHMVQGLRFDYKNKIKKQTMRTIGSEPLPDEGWAIGKHQGLARSNMIFFCMTPSQPYDMFMKNTVTDHT